MKESAIQAHIITYLQYQQNMGKLMFERRNNAPIWQPKPNMAKGGFFRRPCRGSQKGTADIFVLKNGRAIFLEVKSDTGKQSPEQKTFQELVVKHGARYFIVRSLAEVQSVVENDGLDLGGK